MDGYVTIGTELDTKNFDIEIRETEHKLRNLEKEYEIYSKHAEKGSITAQRAMRETELEIEKTANKLVDLRNKQEKIDFSNAKSSLDGISNGISKVIGKVGKWALAVFSIRSAYMLIRQAVNQLATEDDQIKYDIEYLKWILTQTLKPIVQWLIQAIYYILYAVNNITQQLFNWNILAGKSVNDFKNMKKNTGGVVSDLKEARKQLAGFDEMNVLADNVKASGGGAGGDIEDWMPSVDPESWQEKGREALNNFVKGFLEHHEEVTEIREAMSMEDWFDVFGNWGLLVKGFTDTMWGLEEYVIGFGGVIEGELKMIVGIFSGNEKLIEEGWQETIDGMEHVWTGLYWTIIGLFEQLIGAIMGGILSFLDWLFPTSDDAKMELEDSSDGVKNSILDDAEELGEELGKKIGKFIYEDIPKFIADLLIEGIKLKVKIEKFFNNLPYYIQGIINQIVMKFQEMGGKVGEAIGSALKSAINGILQRAENVLNSPIRAINELIDKVNSIPGVNLSRLRTFSLPRLAKGGIVSMPGRGVPVGSAIAGERGQEAVLPLTDSQQMALLGEAIGKYITINANITNTMNGRVISRELQRINNESDFSFNR